MTPRLVVDIAEHGRRVSLERGFLVVSSDEVELGRVPVDDVSAVILSAYGTSYTTPLVAALAERGAILVICDKNHLPVAWTLPVAGHHGQTRIISAQINAGEPLKKRLWQYVVQTKIEAQATALNTTGRDGRFLYDMIQHVKSGDTTNVEARAAIEYWPTMFGEGFRRDREEGGINAMLNYGYTVLRASMARAVVASGLHPSISIYHRRDPLALADDLMEPFRPVVDCRVSAVSAVSTDLTRESREDMVEILGHTDVAVLRYAQLIASAFRDGEVPRRREVSLATDCLVRLANDNGIRPKVGDALPTPSNVSWVREDTVFRLHKAVAGGDGATPEATDQSHPRSREGLRYGTNRSAI